MQSNIKIEKSKNKAVVSVGLSIYPLEAVYGAAYVFLDKAFIFLERASEESICVHLKGKEKMTKKKIEKMAGDFLNELLNYTLRYKIAKNNRKIREYIVGAALIGASGEDVGRLEVSGNGGETGEWKEDPLGIAVPWEEKYGKKEKQDNQSSCSEDRAKNDEKE